RHESAFGVLARVHGVQARDHVERVLVEGDAAVFEADRVLVAGVAPEDAELVLHSPRARRRRRTPSARISSSATVSSQPRQGSVIETPRASGLPGTKSW